MTISLVRAMGPARGLFLVGQDIPMVMTPGMVPWLLGALVTINSNMEVTALTTLVRRPRLTTALTHR